MGRYSWSDRRTAEECKTISVFWLRRHDYFCGFNSGSIVWTDGYGKETYSIGVNVLVDSDSPEEDYVRLIYTTIYPTGEEKHFDYKIQLVKTPCYFGGYRYWFICPLVSHGRYCGRRVAKLYKPPFGNYFGCRHCYDLTYRSQKEHKRKPVDYQKLLEKMDKFEKRYKKRKMRSKKKTR